MLTMGGLFSGIYDSTPNTGNKRGDDISAWFNRHPSIYNYVILDDDSDMTVHMEHLVKTSFDEGLTRADVDKAIEILKGERKDGVD